MLGRDTKIFCNAGIEVTLVGAIRGPVWPDRGVTVNLADTNDPNLILNRFRFEPKKPLVKPHLRLRTEIIVESGEDNDDFVTGVCSLTNQTCVVASLPGLDVPYDEASPIPGTISRRIFQQSQDCVTGSIKGLDGPEGQLPLKPLAMALPITPFAAAGSVQPLDVATVAAKHSILPYP